MAPRQRPIGGLWTPLLTTQYERRPSPSANRRACRTTYTQRPLLAPERQSRQAKLSGPQADLTDRRNDTALDLDSQP